MAAPRFRHGQAGASRPLPGVVQGIDADGRAASSRRRYGLVTAVSLRIARTCGSGSHVPRLRCRKHRDHASGLFDGEALRAHWRIMTDVPAHADEYGVLAARTSSTARRTSRSTRSTGVAIGSVVPRDDRRRSRDACRALAARAAARVIVDARVAAADHARCRRAAHRGRRPHHQHPRREPLYERDSIVVDLGTATTFDCITARRRVPWRRDRAGRTYVGGDADSAHVEAAGDGAGAAGAGHRDAVPRTASGPASCSGRPTRSTAWCAASSGVAAAERPMVIATGGLAERVRARSAELDERGAAPDPAGLAMAFDAASGG